MESQAAQKLERQQAKVDRKRFIMQNLTCLQMLVGAPYATWLLFGSERAVLTLFLATLGLCWSLVGMIGLYAVTARRVQALVVFTSLEILLAMLSSCGAATMLLLHHLNCWTPKAMSGPSATTASVDALQPLWLRCSNMAWLLAASAAMVLYLAATASEALSLRLRIQKTGKRNLSWNQKPMRWKERNVRRGASPALRALVPQLKDGDSRIEEDARLKYLATHDRRYIHKSLLIRFDTLDELGDHRRLLLDLRKGYFKQGEIFGTKIYLSQVTDVLLDESDAAVDDKLVDRGEARREALRRVHRGFATDAEDLATDGSEQRPTPERLALALTRTLEHTRRWLRDALAYWRDGPSAQHSDDDQDGTGMLYSCIVHAHTTTARWKTLFGLSSKPRAVCLDFRRPDERDRFIAYVEALLPPSIRISHVAHQAIDYSSSTLDGPVGLPSLRAAEKGINADGRDAVLDVEVAAGHGGVAAVGGRGFVSGLAGTAGSLAPQVQKDGSRAIVPLLNAVRASPGAACDCFGSSMLRAPRGRWRTEPISIFVGSWNMGDAVAPAALDGWLPRGGGEHDIFAIATQECSDEHWPMALDSHLGSDYVRVAERRMGGIALIVFTHRRHATKINGVETSFTPTGVLGVGTNKGAVALAFCIRGVRVCVVNAHLAAHQDKLLERNRHVQEITKHLRLGTTTIELPLQYHTIWAGDLNYRISESRGEVVRLVEAQQWHELYARDQLAQELAADRVLFGFAEATPLAFPPTYKYVRVLPAAHRRRGFGKIALRTRSFARAARPGEPGTSSSDVARRGGGGDGSTTNFSSPERPQQQHASSGGSNGSGNAPGRLEVRGGLFHLRRTFNVCGDSSHRHDSRVATDEPNADGAGSIHKETAGAPAGLGFFSPPLLHNAPSTQHNTPAVDRTLGRNATTVGAGSVRKYDEEKNRVPSWCDRVLWRSLPGAISLVATSATDCDDPQLYASDHAPVTTIFELDLPVLPVELPLHHCTIYLSNLALYRARARSHVPMTSDLTATLAGTNLTARSAMGKGVPLPVAGDKLQNLPPQLTVYAHMLVLHKLLSEPPHHAAALSSDGRSATNIVIGPMLAQREYLAMQQVQLRVVSLSGGQPTELGQAVFSLEAAADGAPAEFDVNVERLTVPAGFNLRGTVSIMYTKTLAEDHPLSTRGARVGNSMSSSFLRRPDRPRPVAPSVAMANSDAVLPEVAQSM